MWSCPQSLPWLSWPLEEGVSRGFGAVAGSVRPTVAGRADVGIGTGPLESALPLIPRDAYARPLSSARIAGGHSQGCPGETGSGWWIGLCHMGWPAFRSASSPCACPVAVPWLAAPGGPVHTHWRCGRVPGSGGRGGGDCIPG